MSAESYYRKVLADLRAERLAAMETLVNMPVNNSKAEEIGLQFIRQRARIAAIEQAEKILTAGYSQMFDPKPKEKLRSDQHR